MIRREVKWHGNMSFCGEGYKSVESFGGRKRWYVRDPDGIWYTTNNRDWEPECEVDTDRVEMVIVGYYPGREPHEKRAR